MIGFWVAAWLLCASLCFAKECKTLAFVNSIVSRQHWTGEEVSLVYGDADEYRLLRKLGQGTYGEAYLGVNVKRNFSCVIKIYTSKMAYTKMLREALILQTVCGSPNVMKIYDIIKESKEGHPALVLEYIDSSDADVDSVYQNLSPVEVQYYMQQFLIGLSHVHKLEIIHRDIKPRNVLIDPKKRILRVIDFGLAMFYEYAPEMLVKYRSYDFKVDIWSFAAMFAPLILRSFPLFHGSSSEKVMMSIVDVLGSDDLASWLQSIDRSPNTSEPLYTRRRSRRPLRELVQPGQEDYATPEALDLLDKLLRWNPNDRLSAKEALQHPYFAVRLPARNVSH